jgi:hypothetical protein
MPSFAATAVIAAYSDSYSAASPRPSAPPAHATPAGRHQNVIWLDPPQEVGPLPNPGRFTDPSNTAGRSADPRPSQWPSHTTSTTQNPAQHRPQWSNDAGAVLNHGPSRRGRAAHR